MWIWSGSAEGMMAEILAALAEAESADLDDRSYYRNTAMRMLIGLHEREAIEGPVPPDRAGEFRARFAAAVLRLGNAIPAYVLIAASHAEGVNDESGLYEAAISRSAIELFRETVAGTPAAALVDLEEVAELDRDLRRLADTEEPLPESCVPPNIPSSHWWWRRCR